MAEIGTETVCPEGGLENPHDRLRSRISSVISGSFHIRATECKVMQNGTILNFHVGFESEWQTQRIAPYGNGIGAR